MNDFRKYGSPFDPKFTGSGKDKNTATMAYRQATIERADRVNPIHANFSMIEQAILRDVRARAAHRRRVRPYPQGTDRDRGRQRRG